MLTATVESQQWTLANMLLHLGPTEAFKEDGFFINSLRKYAVNEVADAIRREIKDAQQAKLAAERAASEAVQPSAVTPTTVGGNEILEVKTV